LETLTIRGNIKIKTPVAAEDAAAPLFHGSSGGGGSAVAVAAYNVTYAAKDPTAGRNVPVPIEIGPRIGKTRRPKTVVLVARTLNIRTLELDCAEYADEEKLRKRNDDNYQKWVTFAAEHRSEAHRLHRALNENAARENDGISNPA
jgi:hypothetical protein